MKHKIVTMLLAVCMLIAASGCSNMTSNDQAGYSSSIDIIKGEETYAKPAVISIPDGTEIPEYYIPVSISGVNEPVFIFMDESGNTQLRVFARQEVFENDVYVNSVSGFFVCELEQKGDGPTESAETKTATNENGPAYQLLLREIATNDTPGTPTIKSVDKQASVAATMLLPQPYSAGADNQNIFCFEDASGVLKYCVYGTCSNGESGFWYSDENGSVIPGMPMANMNVERELFHDTLNVNQEGAALIHYFLLTQGDLQIDVSQIG